MKTVNVSLWLLGMVYFFRDPYCHAGLLSFYRSIQSTRKLVKNCAEWIIRLTRLELLVEGEEHLIGGSSILVANHASYTDQ